MHINTIDYTGKYSKNGEFGAIHSIDTEMSCLYEKGKRDWMGSFQGGAMQYLGCHLMDLVVRLMGTPDEIFGNPKSEKLKAFIEKAFEEK